MTGYSFVCIVHVLLYGEHAQFAFLLASNKGLCVAAHRSMVLIHVKMLPLKCEMTHPGEIIFLYLKNLLKKPEQNRSP